MAKSKNKLKGGLAIPDVKKYYNAVLLSKIIEWTKETNEGCVKIEKIISSTTLSKVVWIPPQYRELDTNTHVMTLGVFKIWDLTKANWKFNSPLIPLRETSYFSPGKGRISASG